MSDFIEQLGGSDAHALASVVADWDPYKSGLVAEYFDPESMFGVSDGFDITIGNPPYVRADEQSEWNQKQRRQVVASKEYETLWEKWDLFVPFIERSYKLLRPGGVSTLIVSDAFCHAKYAQKPQNWFLQTLASFVLTFAAILKYLMLPFIILFILSREQMATIILLIVASIKTSLAMLFYCQVMSN